MSISIYGHRGRPPKIATTQAKIVRESKKLRKYIDMYLIFEKLLDSSCPVCSKYLLIMAGYCRILARASAEEVVAARRNLSIASQ